MLTVTLHWRKHCEDDGLQHPEEMSGNLFRAVWVCVQAWCSWWDEACVPLLSSFWGDGLALGHSWCLGTSFSLAQQCPRWVARWVLQAGVSSPLLCQ